MIVAAPRQRVVIRRRLPLGKGPSPGYMYYKGGTLQFGKLMMLDADMFKLKKLPAP